MAYTIVRNNNIFTITKTGLNVLYVTVYTQTFCNSNEWKVLIPEQQNNGILLITLPKKDDLYKIVITDKLLLNDTYNVSIYTQFLKSFVEDVHYILCGCSCSDCDDCDKKEKDYLSVITKLLSYNIINDSIYNQYLIATNNCLKCTVLNSNQCILLHESILGNSDNTLLIKQLIAYYYLVFYYTDLKINDNTNENIMEVYKYNTIIQCIKKLGLDENCIKNAINLQTEGIFTNIFM